MAERYSNMRDILAQIREGYSPKEVKMAIGIASDPRYKGGNYTGAVTAIEKIKKGLSKHPQVAAVLKRQNEDVDPSDTGGEEEVSMAMTQLAGIRHFVDGIEMRVKSAGDMEEWYQNKLTKAHDYLKTIYAYGKGDVAESLEEGAMSKINQAGKDLARYAAKDKKDVDYKDYMKAAAMMTKGKLADVVKFTMDLDTEPRDVIIQQVKDALGKDATEKLFKVSISEAKEVLSRFRDDKLKQNTINLAKQSGLKVKDMGDKIEISGNARRVMDITLAVQKQDVKIEELEEGKSSTGYELYHKDFSSAMKHAYDFAKKKFGIEVDPKEIDDKVASGPRKPSKGKTNSYRLLGKDGKKAIQVQVYGMDNGKYELNMYKESVDLEEGAFGELQIAAKDLAKYASKDKKDMDYKDFMKAAAMMKTGKVKELAKFTNDLDTEPRDKIIDMVKGAIGKTAAEKLFNVTIREEVELTEKLKVSDGLGAWIDDFMKSDAPQFQGKSDEEKKNMAIAAFTDAGGKLVKEEEEPQKPDSAKEVEQGREDKKKTRIAQLQLQIAKAQETINKLNAQEK